VVHSWKVRYFVLTKSHMKYFAEKRQGCKPIKNIPLVSLSRSPALRRRNRLIHRVYASLAIDFCLQNGATLRLEKEEVYNRKNAFSLTTSDSNRVYVLVATNDEDQVAWINDLQQVIK